MHREFVEGPTKLAAEGRRTAPVKLWASLGLAFVILEVYVFSAWIVSGKATPTPTGSTPVPGWMTLVAHAFEIVGLVILVGFGYWFIVRPWRRERRVTLDGMLMLAIALLYWQDPIFNYTQNWSTINAVFVNWGSWTTNIPGWLAPNSNQFAEAVVWVGPLYVYVIFGATLLASALMRRAKQRWPEIGTVGLVGLCFAFLVTADLVLECLFIRLGLYSFPGAIRWMTLFPGHYYQFPIYEAVFWAAMWTGLASLRYFRNDKGETVAERGASQLAIPPKQRTVVRFLAIVGVTNVIYLGVYNVPIQWFALHADPWPEDVLRRSYLTNGLCGPDTSYACSGPGVPIPRGDSSHVDPDGDLVESDSSSGDK